MKAKDNALGAGMKRLNALMGWWGVPIASGHGMLDEQMKRLQQCASEMQKTCGDAYSGRSWRIRS